MTSVQKALRSVKRKLRVLSLVHSLLLGVIAFLVVYVGGVFFEVDWRVPAAFGGIAALFALARGIKKIQLREAEQRIPRIEWQLRTAEDTLNKDNEVVRSLHEDVLRQVEHIRTSSLLNKRKLLVQVAVACVLFAMVFVLPTVGFTASAVKETTLTGLSTLVNNGGNFFGDDSKDNQKDDGRSLKEGDIERVGGPSADLKLQQSTNEIDLNKVKDEQRLLFTRQSQLQGLGVSADASYEEDISSDQELIERYFKNLEEPE